MNKYYFFIIRVLTASVMLLLCSCHAGLNDPTVEGTIVKGEYLFPTIDWSEIYYNLRTGVQVNESQSSTTNWDIMIRGSNFFTNSGETAVELGSAGAGGSYYTGLSGSGAFSGITIGDVPAPGDFEVDQRAWFEGMGIEQRNYNSMNILFDLNDGQHGSGTQEDPYSCNLDEYADPSDDEAIYKMVGMPPQWFSTDRIYIIRCAHGARYAKLKYISHSQGFGAPGPYYIIFDYEMLN